MAQHLTGVSVVFDDEDPPRGLAGHWRRLGGWWAGDRCDAGETACERASAARPRTRHVDAPLVEVNEAFDECEADAQAGPGAMQAGLPLDEQVEDPREQIGRNAGPRVLHAQIYLTPGEV